MKMITKVFLVIAVLVICLIVWALFLGGNGVIENGWNGIADSINETWIAVTGADEGIVPNWKSDVDDIGTGIDDLDDAGGVSTGP